MKYTILDNIGNHFMHHAVELIKNGCKFVFVMDNIDWTVRVHEMQSDNQNRDVHAVATSLVFDRVPKKKFSSYAPKLSLSHVNVHKIVTPNDEEMACTRARYKILLGNIICEYLQAFKHFKDLVGSTSSIFPVEMSSPSVIIPFPVLMKDEKKYSDLVDVLDTMEMWIQQLYSKAGVVSNSSVPVVIRGPTVGTTSRPDQPGANIPRNLHPDDPLPKVPCYGDQLSRVRLAGGKDLRAGCHTATDRLDHLYPFRIADWHTKQSLLKLIFKKLYKDSAREIGTLRYFREMLQRRNVTKDVKHFEECEQFFLAVGKSYTVQALLNFFGMNTENDPPRKNSPPYHLIFVDEHRKKYWYGMLDNFINEYLLGAGNDITQSNLEDIPTKDFVREHSLLLLKYYFLIVDLKDAVREGNGLRINQLHKQLLRHFKTDPGYNAYGIEMFINIIQNEVLLTEEEAYQCTWAATANWTGGKGKNLEIDLMQENRNRDLKHLIKSMGSNKTDKAIEQASKAVGGIRKSMQNFDAQVAMHAKSSSHSHKTSSSDELKILKALHDLRPFVCVSNRKHNSFSDVSSDPLHELDEGKFNEWLTRHKKNLLYNVTM